MASYNTPITMLGEFFDGKTKSSIKRQSLFINTRGYSGPGLYSYGNHYPVMVDLPEGIFVNTANVGVTTSTQRNGVIAGLIQMGYRETDITWVDPQSKYTFVKYAPVQG